MRGLQRHLEVCMSLSARSSQGGMVAKSSAAKTAPVIAADVAARETVGLDRLIHERMRLGIVSALAANESLTFGELKKLLDASDGNVSIHARKLEEAGYITC